jgi:hypothetical protein
MNAVFVPYDDRRIFAIRVSNDKIGNTSYFDALFEDTANPAVLRDFYDFLGSTRDLRKYKNSGMQWATPKTEFWASCVRMGASSMHSFLSAFVTRELQAFDEKAEVAKIEMLASEFRKPLHAYQARRSAKLTPDNQVSMRINELGVDTGFSFKTSHGVSKYSFDLIKMKAFLVKRHLFDEEATY